MREQSHVRTEPLVDAPWRASPLGEFTIDEHSALLAQRTERLCFAILINACALKHQTLHTNSLQHDCCPACGYDLAGLPKDTKTPDGCTICPECSAAWKRGEKQPAPEKT